MKNPYEDIFEPEEIHVPRGIGRVALVVFLLVCTIPPLWRNAAELFDGDEATVAPVEMALTGKDLREGNLTARLRELEGKIEDAAFTDLPRRSLQELMTDSIGQGNVKTLIGDDGWLFLRPAVRAMTSTGPLDPPALGVASDPNLKKWRRALPAILQFGEDLKERGVELLFVPIPVKPMIYPEMIAGESLADGPLRHPDQQEFYAKLREAGIGVVDLVDPLWKMKKDGDVYMKQDTHWRPRAMERVAEILAEEVKSRSWFAEVEADSPKFEVVESEREHIGDLVEQLGLPEGSELYSPEGVVVRRVLDKETGEPVKSDEGAEVVLLGDSFTNIFHDASIGFGENAEEEAKPIGAGLAQHLASKLGSAIDVIARNGSASTAVRKDFARRFDDEVRAKKIVIWTVAARDVLYTPKLGTGNEVVWEDVVWNPLQKPESTEKPGLGDGEILVEATLSKDGKGPIGDPKSVPYQDAIFEMIWESAEAIEGEGLSELDGQIVVKSWGFKKKEMTAASRIEEGKRYRFRVQLADAVDGVSTAQGKPLGRLENDFSLIGLDFYFAEEFEEVE
ncbi:MAG: hypothetical protein AAGA58_09060 [Verrucomicrobiota bacterium]